MNPHRFLCRAKRALFRLVSIAVILSLLAQATPARAQTGTSVCGPVSGVWTSAGNNYNVTCDIQVLGGTTLTIQPGVVVKFDAGTSLRVDGTLDAQGATFTSSNPFPAAGDWGRIFLTASSVDAVFDTNGNYVSGSIVQSSLIEWGGGGAGVNGAIEIASASPFINQNTIQNSGGRGVYAAGRSANLPVIISRNSVNNNRGGIYISAGYVTSNTIQGNSFGGNGGGIFASNSSIISNTISTNSAEPDGGGVYASGSTLTGNTIGGNSAFSGFVFSNSYGGGVYATGSTLTNNTISGNSVTANSAARGGGIYATGGTLANNVVNGNSLTSGWLASGGGIYATLSTVTGNRVSGNSASAYEARGGGIYASGTTATGNIVTGNSSNASDYIGFGGGIFADGGTVSNNTVSNNATSGGSDNQGGGIYGDTATLLQNTITGNSANKGGAIYAYKGTATGNTILTNTTSLSGTLYIDQGIASLNILRANSAVAGGAIYATNATLTGNTAENNTANVGAGIYSIHSTVLGNTLRGNHAISDGGGLYANGGGVTNNALTENTVPSWGHGSGAYLLGVTDFSYNSVLTNTASGGTAGGVSIINGSPIFGYNNLYGNQPYDAEVVSSQNATGTLNYWGLLACTAIPARIYDGNDAPGRGRLSYAPSLYSPAPVAQLAAPENLVLTEGQNSVTLSWSPIPGIPNVGCRVPGSSAPDLVYRVYYDTDSACGPYDGKGLPAGDSPITVGTNTQITLSGASPDRYVFVVAAYDYLGRESAYSNLMGNLPEAWKVYLPLVTK